MSGPKIKPLAATGSRLPVTPTAQAFAMVIRENLRRHALWKVKSCEDFLDQPRDRVLARIDCGDFWAFNIGTGCTRKEIRILAYSVVETFCGPFPDIGATRNLNLDQVIDLVLPVKRDPRSTELKRFLSCTSQHVYKLAPFFKVTQPAAAKDGPQAFTVFARGSVATWLKDRRLPA